MGGMANDFEAAGAGSGGAAADDRSSERERLQQMRRRIRERQERFARTEQRKKAREEELALQWKEKSDRNRAESRDAVQARLAQLERQRLRAQQRAAQSAEAQAAEASPRTLVQAVSGAISDANLGRPAETVVEAAPGMPGRQRPSVPLVDSTLGQSTRGPSASGGTKPEGKAAKKDVSGQRRCSSSWAVPWEKPDGKKQELGVHALVRAMMSGQHPPQNPQSPRNTEDSSPKKDAAAALEAGADGQGQEGEEHEPDAKGHSSAVHRSVARKRRLRMMHLVAGEVLQCRQDMAGAFQHAFAVPAAGPSF